MSLNVKLTYTVFSYETKGILHHLFVIIVTKYHTENKDGSIVR